MSRERDIEPIPTREFGLLVRDIGLVEIREEPGHEPGLGPDTGLIPA
jgi:hypothetical protein